MSLMGYPVTALSLSLSKPRSSRQDTAERGVCVCARECVWVCFEGLPYCVCERVCVGPADCASRMGIGRVGGWLEQGEAQRHSPDLTSTTLAPLPPLHSRDSLSFQPPPTTSPNSFPPPPLPHPVHFIPPPPSPVSPNTPSPHPPHLAVPVSSLLPPFHPSSPLPSLPHHPPPSLPLLPPPLSSLLQP